MNTSRRHADLLCDFDAVHKYWDLLTYLHGRVILRQF